MRIIVCGQITSLIVMIPDQGRIHIPLFNGISCCHIFDIFPENPKTIAALIASKDYAGDILFLSHPGVNNNNPMTADLEDLLKKNERIQLPFNISNFSSNSLELNVNIPDNKSIWILYSDVWHPGWKAFDNGRLTIVERANLAYKAILLTPGLHKIILKFSSPIFSFCQLFLNWVSFVWSTVIIFLVIKILNTRVMGPAIIHE